MIIASVVFLFCSGTYILLAVGRKRESARQRVAFLESVKKRVKSEQLAELMIKDGYLSHD